MRVAFQGELGAYSDEAITSHWGGAADSLPRPYLPDVFDAVEVSSGTYDTRVALRCSEVHTGGETPPIAAKRGYMRVPPSEHLHNLRSEITLMLESLGVPVPKR